MACLTSLRPAFVRSTAVSAARLAGDPGRQNRSCSLSRGPIYQSFQAGSPVASPPERTRMFSPDTVQRRSSLRPDHKLPPTSLQESRMPARADNADLRSDESLL